jgi:hypothetical protein
MLKSRHTRRLEQPANMKASPIPSLSRRERQIMDVIYRLGRATAAEVTAELPDPPTSTTVRGLLRIIERKGQHRHVADGPRYLYLPCAPSLAAPAPAPWLHCPGRPSGSAMRSWSEWPS